MIKIPETLTLQRNKKDEVALLEASRAFLDRETREQGIHASDLLDLRQAYYRKLLPKDLSDREVTLFLVGKVLHSFVLATGAGDVPDLGVSDAGSRYNEDLGIWYSMDWDRGSIAEFKTSRRQTEPQTVNDVDTYIEQLLIYMASKQVCTAKLWILFINLRERDSKRTVPAFRCYTVTIQPTDLVSITEEVSNQVQLLNGALVAQDPLSLPLCRTWKCGEGNCGWWNDCRPEGRFGYAPDQWQK